MENQVEFNSGSFPLEAGEEEKTNPGIRGQALARWIFEELPKHGVETGKIIPEGWGWVVTVPDEDFFLWIGCGGMDGIRDRWRCFVEAEGGWLKRLMDRAAPERAKRRVADGLDRLLRSSDRVADVEWLAGDA